MTVDNLNRKKSRHLLKNFFKKQTKKTNETEACY